MNILKKLTIKNLRLNKKRTIVTIIGIILSTSLMVGIGLLFSSFQDYMIRETKYYNGNYLASYQNVNTSKLKNLTDKELTYFYMKPLGFSKFNSNNEYKPYIYITSVNKNFFSELTLVEGSFPQNDNEIVISKHVNENGGANYKIGEEINLSYGNRILNNKEIINNTAFTKGENIQVKESKTYKIVGIVNRSQYEDYEASGYTFFTLDVNNNSEYVNLYISFNQKSKIIKQAETLAEELNYKDPIKYNTSLLALYGESTYGNIMSSMIKMLIIMLLLVSIGCIIVIYNSFAISVMERKKEFGLLASVGTTRRQLSYTVFFEALIVGTIGIILGLLGAYIGIGIVIIIINNLIGDILIFKLNLITKPLFIIIPIIFMILVIFISAFIPSKRAGRVSPIEAIRQNDDIKINKKKIKVNKIIQKIFGIEGEIALKNIKRNKKKYRVTIVSLFISIVLFISFSSYMNYTLNIASEMSEEINYDYYISYYDDGSGNSEEIVKKINEILSSEDVEEYTSYNNNSVPVISNYEYTSDYLNFYKNTYGDMDYLLNSNYKYISVVVLDDNSYNNYKDMLGLDSDTIILLNKIKGVSYSNNKRINYNIPVIKNNEGYIKICDFAGASDIEIEENTIKYCNKTINNIFITNKYSSLMENLLYSEEYKLIVNKRIYDSIFKPDTSYTEYNIISNNTSNIDKITKSLDSYNNVNYTNIEEEYKQTNNMILVIKILMYGFISLVTLIGVTSVFNTISTSMALRKKEFAILRSIGLNKKGFNKILFFESLFFGIKSLIFAIPVSIGITLIIHYSLADVMSISSIIIPWKHITISVIGVFMIVLITMMYSTSKIKKQNIIDEIREENI